MNLKSQKVMAAKILKAGIGRVKVENDVDVSEAITRNDIKELIARGLITTVQKKGQCKAPSKMKSRQKKKGRKSYKGSKKGTKNSRKPGKEKWMEKIRPIRKMLKGMKDAEQIENTDYRKLYRLASGGTFRSKKHILMYIKDHNMLKGPKPRKKKSSASEKKKVASAKPVDNAKPADVKKKPVAKKKVKKDVKKA